MEKAIVLFLDGHASRNGLKWIEEAQKCNIEIILLPANTTHFLQPCDNDLNKTFQRVIRETRDALLKMATTNVHAMGFKLKLAVAGHAGVTPDVVRKSFVNTGIWPMDYRFAERLRDKAVKDEMVLEKKCDRITSGGVSSAVASARMRKNDVEIYGDLKKALDEGKDCLSTIRHIERILEEHETVSSILKGIKPPPKARNHGSRRGVLGCGAPAQCLTVGDLIARRKQAEADAKAEDDRKRRTKEERVKQKALQQRQREAARIEKQQLKRQRAEEKAARDADKASKKRQKTAGGRRSGAGSAAGTSLSPVVSVDAAAAAALLALGTNEQ